MLGISTQQNYLKEAYSFVGIGEYYNEIDLALSVTSLSLSSFSKASLRFPAEIPTWTLGMPKKTVGQVSIYGKYTGFMDYTDVVNMPNSVSNWDTEENESLE